MSRIKDWLMQLEQRPEYFAGREDRLHNIDERESYDAGNARIAYEVGWDAEDTELRSL